MSRWVSDADYDYDVAELMAEAAAERRYRNQLARHPDPRDPDHPERPDDEGEEE